MAHAIAHTFVTTYNVWAIFNPFFYTPSIRHGDCFGFIGRGFQIFAFKTSAAQIMKRFKAKTAMRLSSISVLVTADNADLAVDCVGVKSQTQIAQELSLVKIKLSAWLYAIVGV